MIFNQDIIKQFLDAFDKGHQFTKDEISYINDNIAKYNRCGETGFDDLVTFKVDDRYFLLRIDKSSLKDVDESYIYEMKECTRLSEESKRLDREIVTLTEKFIHDLFSKDLEYFKLFDVKTPSDKTDEQFLNEVKESIRKKIMSCVCEIEIEKTKIIERHKTKRPSAVFLDL